MLNPIYVTDQILDNFPYQVLKTIKPSTEKLKTRQKTHLITYFNDLIDKGISNPNITILGEHKVPLGECISYFEENNTIYLLTFNDITDYHVYILNGENYEIIARVDMQTYEFAREGCFSIILVLEGVITVVTPFNLFSCDVKEKRWKITKLKDPQEYFNVKLVYYNEIIYGMFDSGFYKLDRKFMVWDEIEYQSELYPKYLMRFLFTSFNFAHYCSQVIHENK